jgi:hypothetical protein
MTHTPVLCLLRLSLLKRRREPASGGAVRKSGWRCLEVAVAVTSPLMTRSPRATAGTRLSPVKISVKRAMDRYINAGLYPGGFLDAVIRGDDAAALSRADDHNKAHYNAVKRYVVTRLRIGK